MAISAEEGNRTTVYQLFVKQFNGKTLNLKFTAPSFTGQTLIDRIHALTLIPPTNDGLLYLLSQNRLVQSQTLIHADPDTRLFPSVTILSRLLGGKGGFGSLLRGAATKAGQKKTNNFDACRDMNGRRLRHVNAEKKLEEWKEGEDERMFEKIAEDFLKKKAKSSKGSVKGDSADKYVAKYREDSAKCVAEVESAVREAFERERKRKGVLNETVDAKKLKIWLGKKKIDENDDMDDDSSDEEEDQKSTIINNQESPKDNPGSVSDGEVDGHSSGGSAFDGVENSDAFGVIEPQEVTVDHADEAEPNCVEADTVEPQEVMVEHADEPESDNVEADTVGAGMSPEDKDIQTNGSSNKEPEAEEKATTKDVISVPEEDRPIDFDEYDSAAAMEVLGMERLKSELQAHGLKCGGTLQERAARLFLLKTTPVEKLPKKLLAKK
ncbi:unnamed protein product [Rhodiola kirilowii]